MLVRTSLEGGEDSLVDAVFESTFVLTEENHSSTGSTKGLVSCGCHNIAIVERRRLLSSGDQSGNVRHVHHQKGPVGISDFSEFGVVPVTGVSRSSADDHGRFEKTCITGKLLMVNISGLGVNSVWKRFEVNRSGRDSFAGSFLLRVRVKPVCQVTTAGQIQSHDSFMRAKEGGVDGKIGRGPRVRLDIDAPLLGVQSIGCERTLLAKNLDLVNNLVTSVVSGVGETFRILVRQS
ncbi:unnamed protein product [Pseudo-nitzschia multistriata]|uniref:Uncharacterized protein n=1 Tax=Pseudo-nitzschia multistriata TaxID=183589 RepID=A0A448ZF89_9STRA|nr:unnamed protein product [Pseudo-nitzschia multistriata]